MDYIAEFFETYINDSDIEPDVVSSDIDTSILDEFDLSDVFSG